MTTKELVVYDDFVSRFVRALLLCACVHVPLLWAPAWSENTSSKLDVWIDGKEVEQFVGK